MALAITPRIAVVIVPAKHAIPFILSILESRSKQYLNAGVKISVPPLFLGINGIQGCGKSTLKAGRLLCHLEIAKKNVIPVGAFAHCNLVLSLDDFYLKHDDQVELAAAHPANPLVQHRGQPSTHDLPLLRETIASLLSRKPTRLPSYDKSAFNGAGDRTDPSTWEQVNSPDTPPIDVVILEGWCMGFRYLNDIPDLYDKWQWAVKREKAGLGEGGLLGKMRIGDIRLVNDALKEFDDITDLFDAFIHLDALDTRFVYTWRLEAETQMRAAKGRGMTEEQVKRFVDGYFPSYELYTERLREGVLKDKPGHQLRLVLDKDRVIKLAERI